MGRHVTSHSFTKEDHSKEQSTMTRKSAAALDVPEDQPPSEMEKNIIDDDSPKAVSSDDEEEEAFEEVTNNENDMSVGSAQASSQATVGYSRYFSPYRTLGIISNGRPFHLVSHDHSANSMVAIPIGDRFQFMRTDHLRPSLVSQAVSVESEGKQEISHLITDSTLSISVAAHGRQPKGSTFLTSNVTAYSNTISLFYRTTPIDQQGLVPQGHDWSIQDLLHLGHVKMTMSKEKEGKLENAVVVAAVLRKIESEDDVMEEDGAKSVPIVGNGDEESSDDSSSDSEDDGSDMDSECSCQVVIMIASRQSLKVQKRIYFSDHPNFSPLAAVHPSTYLNKIVVGGYDSKTNKAAMILLNVRSGKMVHYFTCVSDNSSKVTTLSQSPAVDTIAVGTSQGMVHLVNLRHDKRLFSLEHRSKSGNIPVRINTISFRTDSTAAQYSTSPMAVGRQDGTITVWDLTPPEDPLMGRSILCEISRSHAPGGVSRLQFLPQEPLLISTGTASNAIVMHIFDNPDHSARVLRQRKGHTSPPRVIQYLHPGAGAGGGILANSSDGTDAAASQILSSGGMDRALRVFSTARTVKDKEYGQGRGLEKKAKKLGLEGTTDLLLPPLLAMASCEARSRDWGDLVTIHEDSAFAYVWNTRNGAQTGPVLRQDKWNVSAMKAPPPTHAHATSVAISACGNFALVGSRGGTIYKYNLQSGMPRGTYPREEKAKAKRGSTPGDINRAIRILEKNKKMSSRSANQDQMEINAELQNMHAQQLKRKLTEASHMGSTVTGIAVDALNKTILSCGNDGKLILWNLATHYPHKKSPFILPAPAVKLCLVRDSGLAAIALNDYSVLVFDTSTQSVIRRFGTKSSLAVHQGPITDVGFSPDGRSLYTASMDSTLRVWDVPTDSCVDWLGFKTPPTSIAISPTGEFITTSHAGNLGLSIWTDRSFYETIYNDGELPSHPYRMDEPTPLSENWDKVEDSNPVEKRVIVKGKRERKQDDSPPSPKDIGLVTLSGLPPSHWKNLSSLELVKARNKPKEAPKKPESAPFFLQWRAGEAIGGDTEQKDSVPADDQDDWAAAWSDDEGGAVDNAETEEMVSDKRKNSLDETKDPQKRRKLGHSRSHFTSLLQRCHEVPGVEGRKFKPVTDYISTLGPSGIDVALSSLCSGTHDLEEGLPLLCMAAEWLLEEVRSRERFESVNAYLHRFLFLHAAVISGIEESKSPEEVDADEGVTKRDNGQRQQLIDAVRELKESQWGGQNALRSKMQRTICMLRHLSRMV